MYSVSFVDVAVSAAQDLFEIAPADDKKVVIHGLVLGQDSDVGDAAEELLSIQIIRGHATSGSGGSAFTPVPLDADDPAAGAATEVNNTTIASTGTAVRLHADTFNVRAGYQWIPTPEMRPMCAQGGSRIVVRLDDAPADALTMSGTLYFEEL